MEDTYGTGLVVGLLLAAKQAVKRAGELVLEAGLEDSFDSTDFSDMLAIMENMFPQAAEDGSKSDIEAL